jgi:AcrR family transcriptional regulator
MLTAMSEPSQVSGALRSDARRNLELVLAAAERAFARRGLSATLEDVATEAGVGVGTIYRRFSSKDALLEAVFDRKVAAGADLLRSCLRQSSAWDGLCGYLRAVVAQQASDRGLHEFVLAAGAVSGSITLLRARVEPLLTPLVERAKAEGRLRTDFRATDVPLLVAMLSKLAHTDPVLGPDLARRYLEILLKGLGPDADPAEVPAPPDDDSFGAWLAAQR